MAADKDILLLATGIACLVVAVGWTVAAALVTVFLNRRVKRLLAEDTQCRAHATEGSSNDLAFLYYACSALFWPGALVCSILFLREAKTVRMGRVCAVIGLAHVSVIVYLTCAGMFVLALHAPRWLTRL